MINEIVEHCPGEDSISGTLRFISSTGNMEVVESPLESLNVREIEKTMRKCYSSDELMKLSRSPLAKVCPSVLNSQGLSHNSWLSKIIPTFATATNGGDMSSQGGGGNISNGGGGGGGALLPLPTPTPAPTCDPSASAAVSLLPQRRSFATGCQPSSLPQKVLVRNNNEFMLTVKESGQHTQPVSRESSHVQRDRDFRDSENREYRERGGHDSRGVGGGGGGREMMNNRMPPPHPQPYRHGFNNDRDRYLRPIQDRGDFRRNNDRERFDRERNHDRDRDMERSGSGSGPGWNKEKEMRSVEHSSYHQDVEEAEPAWMENGPTSRHDFMELRGFDDDERGQENHPAKLQQKQPTPATDIGVPDVEDCDKNVQPVPVGTSVTTRASPVRITAEASADGECHAQTAEKDPLVLGPLNAKMFGGGSRFSALFNGVDGTKSDGAATSPPQVSTAQPLLAAMSPQEAGRSLLKLLQPKTAEAPHGALGSGQVGGNLEAGRRFKTVEDVEQQQKQESVFRSAQQNRMVQNQNRDVMGAGGSPVPFITQPHALAGMRTEAQSGSQVNIDLHPYGIPDDPSLHKLLNLSVKELTNMRATGHFDHATLLTLIQMKERKENLLRIVTMQSGGPNQMSSQHQQFPYLQHPLHQRRPLPSPLGMSMPMSMPMPMPMPMPLSMPQPAFAHHHHQVSKLHVLYPGNPQFYGGGAPPSNLVTPQQQQGFPPDMISQFVHPHAHIHPHNSSRPGPIHMRSGPILASSHEMHLWQQQQQASAQMARVMSEEAQAQSASQPHLAQSRMSSSSRPSPLLPTSVLRKTVQRADSMSVSGCGMGAGSGSGSGSPVSAGSVSGFP